ncbi:MAG: hypothetical protein Q7S33_02685 [Nanoarchaeota archaeon]|nr:hypothetical protein [Nanoarchaeota archaeon]
MESLCIQCKGKGLCGKPCKILARFIDKAPKVKLHFSGSSPPEIFVGRNDYPNVFSGILSPPEKGETSIFSSPEEWYKKKLSIEQILDFRGQLIYGRKKSHIKSQESMKKVIQEIALASKPVSTEFFLKKQPTMDFNSSKMFTIMMNSAPVEKVILEENPFVNKKVDYIVSDYNAKSVTAINELYKSKILVSHLQKLLSAGLLGLKTQRKMVPTRWAITAVDDIISKELLKKIRFYPEINEILVFNSEYNGNHYEILLLPDKFSFEVIEAEIPGNVWNPTMNLSFMKDYESFYGRKNYAESVTGAYYANRLAVCEFFEKVKKQASVLVLREVRPEYYAPLGVGILREVSRDAFNKAPERAESLEDAFRIMQSRMKIDINKFREISELLKNYGKQKRLNNWV